VNCNKPKEKHMKLENIQICMDMLKAMSPNSYIKGWKDCLEFLLGKNASTGASEPAKDPYVDSVCKDKSHVRIYSVPGGQKLLAIEIIGKWAGVGLQEAKQMVGSQNSRRCLDSRGYYTRCDLPTPKAVDSLYSELLALGCDVAIRG
jgi:ribosomal protein L7/L12